MVAGFGTYSPPGATQNQVTVPAANRNGIIQGHLHTGNLSDALSDLNPLSLSDGGSFIVNFPGGVFKEEQSNSLAIHTYPNQPGARIENMGLEAARYHVRAFFNNHLFPSIQENWVTGTLFNGSDQSSPFQRLRLLLSTPGNKVLSHPIDGDVTVQVHDWTFNIDPAIRDGVIVDILLLQTIDDNTPINQTLPASSQADMSSTAANIDNSIAAAAPNTQPPTMNLNGFFKTLNRFILQAVSYPNNVIDSLSANIVAPVAQGVNATVNNLVNTPGYVVNRMSATINNFNQSVLGTTLATLNNIKNFGNNLHNSANGFQTSVKGIQSSGNAIGAVFNNPNQNYDASSATAFNSINSLNNTRSQNASQLIQKTITAVNDLMIHYQNQNSAQCSPIISNLRQYMFQLQQQQKNLNSSLNVQNKSNVIATFVTKTNITWFALANYLGNNLDVILSLNQPLMGAVSIPVGTTINYLKNPNV